jgi:hypothetical protein
LYQLWKNRNLLEKAFESCKAFGKDEVNPLNDCTQEEFNGIRVLSDLHIFLDLPRKQMKDDFKKIERLYSSVIDNN